MQLLPQLSGLLPWPRPYTLDTLKGDLFGGIMAGIVLFPVSLSYGVISGLGPMAGLYGAIAVSLFGSLFGGVYAMIRGPNIFLVTVMAAIVAEHTTSLAEALTIAMLAGIFQIVFGLLKLGRYVAYTPYPLLAGLFSALGFVLFTSQTLMVLGSSIRSGSVVATFQAWPNAIAQANLHALAIAGLAFATIPFWRGRLARFVPVPVVMLVVGWLIGALWLRNAPAIGEVALGFPRPILPVLSPEFLLRNLQPAFILALLSSVSTLVIAFLVDSMTGHQHRPDRELLGLGVGNMVAGLFSGIPGGVSTGVLTNIYSGGRTPVSGITASLFLLAIVVIPGSATLISRIPFAVLGAVVMVTSMAAIEWKFIRRIHRVTRNDAFVFLATFILAIFVDFMGAIVIGFVLSGLLGARRMEDEELRQLISVPVLDQTVLGDRIKLSDPFVAQTGLIIFPGRVSIASARELSRIVTADIRTHRIIVFDMSRTTYLDITAATIMGQLVNTAIARNTKAFVIAGLSDKVAATLHSLDLLARVPKENFARDLDEAHQIIASMLRENPDS